MQRDPGNAHREVPDGTPRPTMGRALLAGAATGVVAALGTVAVGVALYSHRAPPLRSPIGSAFCASLMGGILYWMLARWGRRPRLWLQVSALSVATAMSLMEVWFPAVLRPEPAGLRWVVGLTEPVAQLAAALSGGWRHLSAAPPTHSPTAPQWIRGPFLYTAVVMHFVVAAAAGVLIPRICDPSGGGAGGPNGRRRIGPAGTPNEHGSGD